MESTLPDAAHFWNRIAERYAARPVPDKAIYERKLAITRDCLAPGARVLELGCGTGSTALRLAPHARHILATDVSERMIAIAADKAAAAAVGNVSFECCAAGALRLPAARFDAVLAHSLLHLLEDWRGTIGRSFDLLKPGGVFISSTACLSGPYALLRLVAPPGRALGLLPRLSFFSRRELELAVSDAGFLIEHAWLPAPRRGLFLVARKPA